MRQAAFLAMSGLIVAATLAAAHKKSNTEVEKAALKGRRVPNTRSAKLAQKNRDACGMIKWSKVKPA